MGEVSRKWLSDESVPVAKKNPRTGHSQILEGKEKQVLAQQDSQKLQLVLNQSATCTGWDRGCQSTALWDIVCLALPFVSSLWNACPGEEWSLCAQTTFPSPGEEDVNCPQLPGILLPILGESREAPGFCQQVYLISPKREHSS